MTLIRGRRSRCARAWPAGGPEELLLTARRVYLGKTTEVARALPDRQIRMIGAWCFLDHYGPEDVGGSPGMQVWAHPHTGLQTVSWLLEGEVEHRDSVGSQAHGPAGRAAHHDRGPRHRAQRDLPAGQAADGCTACSCGWRCPTRIGTCDPRFDSYPSCRICSPTGRARQGADRRAGRRARPRPEATPRWSARTLIIDAGRDDHPEPGSGVRARRLRRRRAG